MRRCLTNFEEGTKQCATCLKIKPVSGFYKRTKADDCRYWSSDCISCCKVKSNARNGIAKSKAKIRRATDPDWRAKQNGYHREWEHRFFENPIHVENRRARQRRYVEKNPARQLLSNAKSRAKSLGLDFNLTIDDVQIPETCPVLGIPIRAAKVRYGHNSPTVDRIDNTKGYVRGNVAVISWRANSIKKDATLREMELITSYMREHRQVRLRLVKP